MSSSVVSLDCLVFKACAFRTFFLKSPLHVIRVLLSNFQPILFMNTVAASTSSVIFVLARSCVRAFACS